MKKLIISILSLFILFISGCESCKKSQSDCIVHIAAIKSPTDVSRGSSLRLKTLEETATTVGAQGGLAFRSEQINCILKKQQELLDRIYNFRALMLKDDIKPPVLEEGRQELILDSCDVVRAADQIYRIIAQPCFVSAPPNWRDYIWMTFCKPDCPDVTLLPRCTEEAAVWNCYIRMGWQKGIEQANQIFAENLNRLKRDYNGMVLYRKLLAQNMVTPPYVAKTELGVTSGCNGNEMRIGDRLLRISATSRLNTNPDSWCPAVAKSKVDDVCGPLCPPEGDKCATIKRKTCSKPRAYIIKSS